MLDAFTIKRIEKILSQYVDNKIPKHIRNEINIIYKFRGNNVILLEERPAYMGEGKVEHDIAQFRLVDEMWLVYWRDSKGKWHFVEDITPDGDFEKQLKIVDETNNGLFWG